MNWSKALTAFEEVLDVSLRSIASPQSFNADYYLLQEVTQYKNDCRAAKRDAEEIRALVEQFEAKWVQLDDEEKGCLRQALIKLGR